MVLGESDASERAAGGEGGLRRIGTERLELLLLHRAVKFQFLSQVGFEPAATKEVPRAAEKAKHHASSGRIQDFVNRENQVLEFLPFDRELLTAGGRQRIEPRAAIVLRRTPLGLDPPLQQQPLQRRIERALADLQHIVGDGAQALCDPVAVLRIGGQGLQNQKVERARQKIGRDVFSHRLSMGEDARNTARCQSHQSVVPLHVAPTTAVRPVDREEQRSQTRGGDPGSPTRQPRWGGDPGWRRDAAPLDCRWSCTLAARQPGGSGFRLTPPCAPCSSARLETGRSHPIDVRPRAAVVDVQARRAKRPRSAVLVRNALPPSCRRSINVRFRAPPPRNVRRRRPAWYDCPFWGISHMSTANSFGTRTALAVGRGTIQLYSLPALQHAGFPEIARLPYSMKILLENLLRHEDGRFVKSADIEALAKWDLKSQAQKEISFATARVLLQDFTGVPAVVDLAAKRDGIARLGGDPDRVNPLQPVELVIDHSVQVDYFGRPDAFQLNAELEFTRNKDRYAFLRWGQNAFRNFRVVPPDTGIVHQVNIEYLARVVVSDERTDGTLAYPDTLVGTDSHTTMVNGLGVVGWGVGGIEAEAAMLGQPSSMLIPPVLGVKLTGRLPEGTTATDLVLTVTERLRKHGVVGKFVG